MSIYLLSLHFTTHEVGVIVALPKAFCWQQHSEPWFCSNPQIFIMWIKNWWCEILKSSWILFGLHGVHWKRPHARCKSNMLWHWMLIFTCVWYWPFFYFYFFLFSVVKYSINSRQRGFKCLGKPIPYIKLYIHTVL